MLIWILKDGENIPLQPNARKLRAWLLCDELATRGHSVIWWASTFSHQLKTLFYSHDTEIEVKPNFKVQLLYAGKYKQNVSIQRYLHHYFLSKSFARHAKKLHSPDAIVCSFPITDVAKEAVSYANNHNVPIIVDIRDLWPDTFLEKTPEFLRGVARILLTRNFQKTKGLLSKADNLVAISKGCLDWGIRYAGRPKRNDDKVFYTGYPGDNIGEHKISERIQRFKNHASGKVIFTYIGSFGFSHELGVICDVAKKLFEVKQDKIHFVIGGDGQQYEAISKRAKALPNINLLGWLDKFEIYDLLRLSHVGLVPCRSVVDAMPNKSAELFSAGLPILSSLEGEMEKIITDNDVGYSYKPGDIEALCSLVIKMASDAERRRQQADNAIKLFKSKFSSDIIYSAYADHIERISAMKKVDRIGNRR